MASDNPGKSRDRLIAGVLQFQRQVYPRRKARYEQLAREGQKPHALFITCADSRIDPELLTQSGPGEIFVSRNIGNLVPPYTERFGSMSAIIEYAVTALEVSQIVVCGHTECGAMMGLLHPEKVARLPIVKSWLQVGGSGLDILLSRKDVRDDRVLLEELIEENVIQQLRYLQTHPSVARGLAANTLCLRGWVYDIGYGTVRIYDEEQRKFAPVTSSMPVTSGDTGK